MLPCPKCAGLGWAYAGFNGLAMSVMCVGKDGEYVRLTCERCKGAGQVDMSKPQGSC